MAESDTNFARQVSNEELGTYEGYQRHIGMSPTPEEDALRAFFEFLSEEDSEKRMRSGVIASLADALVLWVTRGDATKVCPSFEHYLQVSIQIIAVWNGEGGWLYSDIEIPRRDGHPLGYGDDWFDSALPTLVRPDSQVQIWNHPAFRRDTFEYARLRRASA